VTKNWDREPDGSYESTEKREPSSTTPLYAEIDRLNAENRRLQKWVDDLQSGMYVNCVYCGHQYGPRGETPVSMADTLKVHVEQCSKHPMSALKHENNRLQAQSINEANQYRAVWDAATELLDALVYPGHDVQNAWEKALTIFGRYCSPYTSTCPETCIPITEEQADPTKDQDNKGEDQ
jgi:hypothetical protein